MITELFLTGLVVGFIYYEIVGISPGGVIAPAYFAMHIYEPGRMLNTLILSFVLLFVIKFLSRHLILYGRRKLLLSILLSFLLKMAIDLYIQPLEPIQFDLQSIGYIIPGLVANEMDRQNSLSTLLSLAIVTIITFQIVRLF